jgi:hypothetical protein
MKTRMILCAGAVFLLALVACDTSPDEYKGEPNIYSILSLDDDFAEVKVGMTLSVDDTIKHDTIIDTIWYDDTFDIYIHTEIRWNGVKGAEVVLKQGSQTYDLKEDAENRGSYCSDSLEFTPNQTWELEVTYPTDEHFVASTTITGLFEITGPLNDTLEWSDKLEWTPSEGARGYMLRGKFWVRWIDEESDTAYIDSLDSYGRFLSADKNSYPVSEILNSVYFYGGVADSIAFLVAAMDTNAFDYHYYGQNSWDASLSPDDFMHIEGAWGVFGSEVVRRSKTFALPADSLSY